MIEETKTPDNVGGLLPCPFCGEPAEMTHRTGGQAVAFSEVYMANCSQCGVNHEIWEGEDEAAARWNRRPELCRAAPAGGDDWPFVEEIGTDGKPTGYWIRKGSPAAARMSDPAGSGEVEELAAYLDQLAVMMTPPGAQAVGKLQRAAAILRKLQQGAE